MELGQSCINQPSDPTGFNSIGRAKKVIFGNRGCIMHGFFSRETLSNNGTQGWDYDHTQLEVPYWTLWDLLPSWYLIGRLVMACR